MACKRDWNVLAHRTPEGRGDQGDQLEEECIRENKDLCVAHLGCGGVGEADPALEQAVHLAVVQEEERVVDGRQAVSERVPVDVVHLRERAMLQQTRQHKDITH